MMPADPVHRRLAAILAADVAGYSRLMGADEEATLRTLTEYRAAMTARIKGYRETVDALVETGHVKGRDAVATKFVLAMVARATPGGSSQLTVPITIQNGMLSAGPARLLRVPTIDWDTGTVELKKSKPN